MTELTGGELLAQALANEGVKFIFGLPCPGDRSAARRARSERHPPHSRSATRPPAVHMAEGLYKTTGQVAAVLGNPGPGSANLVPGVLTARHEGVPVLAITSQHRAGIVYPSTPATFQGQDQLDLFKPVVKWNGPIFEWTRIPELVRMAFREMWAGRPGPVHLEVPGPVMYATGDPATAPIYPAGSGRAPLPQPSAAQLDAAAELLATAKAPVIFAGTGVDRGRRERSADRARGTAGLPGHPVDGGPQRDAARPPALLHVAVPRRGRASSQCRRDPRGGHAHRQPRRALRQVLGRPERCNVIHVDIDPRHIGVSRPVALGIVADAEATLAASLAPARRPWQPRPQGRRHVAEPLRRVRDGQSAARSPAGAAPASTRGRPARRGRRVRARCGVLYRRRHTSLWASMALPSTRPYSYHGILEFGMLGTGIPVAIGAKLGDPSREVVCVTGDGAAGFNVMELQTAAREGSRSRSW